MDRGGIEKLGDRNVVETGNGDVVGDLQSQLVNGAVGPDRHVVIACDQGVGAALVRQHLFGQPVAAFLGIAFKGADAGVKAIGVAHPVDIGQTALFPGIGGCRCEPCPTSRRTRPFDSQGWSGRRSPCAWPGAGRCGPNRRCHRPGRSRQRRRYRLCCFSQATSSASCIPMAMTPEVDLQRLGVGHLVGMIDLDRLDLQRGTAAFDAEAQAT